MLTLFDDTDLFHSGDLKITHFNIPDAELTLYEHFLTGKNQTTITRP